MRGVKQKFLQSGHEKGITSFGKFYGRLKPGCFWFQGIRINPDIIHLLSPPVFAHISRNLEWVLQ